MMRIYKQLLTLWALAAVVVARDAAPDAQHAPANPNASVAARAVLNYLYQIRQDGRILSAQHIHATEEGNEAEHIRDLTGKYPAMIEIDFLDFNRSPGTRQRCLRLAKDWSKQGGLVAVSWHETSPELAALDEGGYAKGTKKAMSQERFDEMLTEGTELNAKWLAHIDLAAQWLGELQEAGVVVLWRPYHEMTGGWFWWGGKKPEAFKALWIMAFQRLTLRHKLNNLVWVWSAAQVGNDYGAYLPLDYVDIAGVDVYRQSRKDQMFVSAAAKIRQVAKNKPVALTEVGTLPTIDTLINHTGFVWFSIWSGGFLDNEHYTRPQENGPGNSPEWIKAIYAHPGVITRNGLRITEASRAASPQASMETEAPHHQGE